MTYLLTITANILKKLAVILVLWIFWQWYYVKAWGPAKWRRCIRINMGWKMFGVMAPGVNVQIVFSVNPLMGYLRENNVSI